MIHRPSQLVRVRIAPSPTGPLHVGTARTALFNWLFAKKENGVFILRIEDTDLERSNSKYEKDIIENLTWLGIMWDEGVGVGGEHPPYRQSERLKTYSSYIKKLLGREEIFYCYHSEIELEKEKYEQFKRKEAPRHICDYFKTRRKINREEGIIRIRPQKKRVEFTDLIRGKIEFDTTLFGDISIARNISTPLYNLAVTIDDFEMKITHVIRGEDHISNTPKQILIQEALGFPRPAYAHLPLILGSDRSKLSKRHGVLSVSWYREQGYLPEAMVNFMALLGWNPGNEREIFTREELIREFSLGRVQKSGAVFSTEKLDWVNGNYIRKMDLDELTKKCMPFLGKQTRDTRRETPEYIKNVVGLEQERMKKLSEIGDLADFFFKDVLEYDKELLRWKGMSKKEVLQILNKLEILLSEINTGEWVKKTLRDILTKEGKRAGDNGRVFWPFRVALSGKKASPDPVDIAVLLGKEKVLERIGDAKKLFSKQKPARK